MSCLAMALASFSFSFSFFCIGFAFVQYTTVLEDTTLNFEIKVGGSTSVQKMSQKLTDSFTSLLKSKNMEPMNHIYVVGLVKI